VSDNKINFQIVEFEQKYQDQVIEVVGKGLMELKVIPKSDEPLQDEDLYQIPDVYRGRGRFWIAVMGDKIIGTVAIRDMGGNTAKLNRMFVLSDYHGKGVGQALFDHAIAFAKEQGYKEVILNTHLLMERAHHFYEKNGFKRVDKEKDKYHYKMDL
jgi:GNAT superfamily N-acetyltransferase